MMNTVTTYNGWCNQNTWNVNLNYEAIFEDIASENQYRSVEDLAEAFESIVFELEVENSTLGENSMARQIVNDYLSKVDFQEIAGNYVDSADEE